MPCIDADKRDAFCVTDTYHFGGFGKADETLLHFMRAFEHSYGFALDRVYTGKLMYGIREMVQQQAFPCDAKILCIHTGGVQGNG